MSTRQWLTPWAFAGAFSLCTISVGPVVAYPEFQQYSQKHSGRVVNCGMCHVNPDGPMGGGPGQLGSLAPGEIDRLAIARVAMAPGTVVDSPILNRFGNWIMEKVGKSALLDIKRDYALSKDLNSMSRLATLMGTEGDLDGDGISNAREFLEGSHPLNPHHGNPWRLFALNLVREKVRVGLVIAGCLLLVFGLNSLTRAAEASMHAGSRTRGPASH